MSPEIEQIRAALLWDVPALVRTNPSGRDFVESLQVDGQQTVWWQPAPPENDALQIAASAVRASRRGEAEQSEARVAQLAEMGLWPKLLGSSIRAWSEPSAAALDVLAADVEAVDLNAEEQAWAQCRMLVCALDASLTDKAEAHLKSALTASEDTALHLVLRAEESNIFGRRPHPLLAEPTGLAAYPPDPLISRDWVAEAALRAGQKHLDELLAATVATPWTQTMRIGRRPLDELAAADLQATWCGAIWQRRPIRRQLAAAALLNEPRDSAQAAWAMWMWMDGGGEAAQVPRIGDRLEPVLAEADVDALLESWRRRVNPEVRREMGISRLASVFWDRCSEQAAAALVNELVVGPGDDMLFDDGRKALVRVGRRSPERFQQRLAREDLPTRAALANDMSSEQIDDLTPEAAARLLEADVAPVTEMLLRQREGAAASGPPPRLPDSDVLVAAATGMLEVDPARLQSAVAQELQWLEDLRADAAAGRFGIGVDTIRTLAQAIVAQPAGGDHRDAVATALLGVAGDVSVSDEHRLQALGGLAVLASRGQLHASQLAEIQRLPGPGSADRPGTVSAERFQAAVLLACAAQLDDFHRSELVALSRSNEPAVRVMAINTAGLALQSGDDPALRWMLTSGLFDAARDVQAMAIDALDTSLIEDKTSGPVVTRRLHRLQRDGDRRVRAAVARCVVRLWPDAKPQAKSNLRLLATGAATDSSWRVRNLIQDLPN